MKLSWLSTSYQCVNRRAACVGARSLHAKLSLTRFRPALLTRKSSQKSSENTGLLPRYGRVHPPSPVGPSPSPLRPPSQTRSPESVTKKTAAKPKGIRRSWTMRVGPERPVAFWSHALRVSVGDRAARRQCPLIANQRTHRQTRHRHLTHSATTQASEMVKRRQSISCDPSPTSPRAGVDANDQSEPSPDCTFDRIRGRHKTHKEVKVADDLHCLAVMGNTLTCRMCVHVQKQDSLTKEDLIEVIWGSNVSIFGRWLWAQCLCMQACGFSEDMANKFMVKASILVAGTVYISADVTRVCIQSGKSPIYRQRTGITDYSHLVRDLPPGQSSTHSTLPDTAANANHTLKIFAEKFLESESPPNGSVSALCVG